MMENIFAIRYPDLAEKLRHPDENTLAARFPELAAEWHPTRNGELTPNLVAAHCNEKAWWLGSCGHEWEAKINNRSSLNRGCPVCAGLDVLPGYNDLATTNPEVAAEWHPTKNGELTPQMVTAGRHKKVWWLGKCGHEWEAAIYSRKDGNGCPYCSNMKVLLGFNDLATTHPELVAEWHPTKNGELTPEVVTAGSTKKRVWWQCKNGHEWQTYIPNRTNLKSGCPVCNAESQTSFPEQAILYYLKKVTVAENRYTELGKEIDIYLPELQVGIEHGDKYYHPNEDKDMGKVKFFAERKIRIITVYGCRQFQQNRAYGDIIEYIYNPYQKESLNWAIKTIFEMLQISAPEIDTVTDEIAIIEQYVQLKKENSLAAKHPELAAQWHPTKNGGVTPEVIANQSNRKVWWICSKGHEWQAPIGNRFSGKGCPVCAGKKVLPGFNDLETLYPELAAQWHPTRNGELMPQKVASRCGKKVWWSGPCGHEWPAIVENRSKHGQGCPYCSGRYAIPGQTDLETTDPALASQWHPTRNGELTPKNVKKSSKQRVWWLCRECGHEWQARVCNRSYFGGSCPKCYRERRRTKNG